ncbi:hypothetical protein HK102_009899, partial [Quaeritorhiza haematococci]
MSSVGAAYRNGQHGGYGLESCSGSISGVSAALMMGQQQQQQQQQNLAPTTTSSVHHQPSPASSSHYEDLSTPLLSQDAFSPANSFGSVSPPSSPSSPALSFASLPGPPSSALYGPLQTVTFPSTDPKTTECDAAASILMAAASGTTTTAATTTSSTSATTTSAAINAVAFKQLSSLFNTQPSTVTTASPQLAPTPLTMTKDSSNMFGDFQRFYIPQKISLEDFAKILASF